MPSYTDLWIFRKQFTAQFAASTFMTYTFFIGHRTPHRITFSRSTGNIFSSELMPSRSPRRPTHGAQAEALTTRRYPAAPLKRLGRPGAAFNINGLLDVTEAVPFRLTPNLQHFMTAVGLEGVFSSALMAIARSLVEPEVRARTAGRADAPSALLAHGGERPRDGGRRGSPAAAV